MANLQRFSALCILMITNSAKTRSQTTSLFGSCGSLNEYATNEPENDIEASQNSLQSCGQCQVTVYVAALTKGQKLLRDRTLAVSEYVSECRGSLATLGSLYHSLQNQTARRDEQLTRQLHLSEREIDNVTAAIAALHRDSSRLDLELKGAAMSLASNVTALRDRIGEAEAASQALVGREVKVAWDRLLALNQTVSHELVETRIATRELRNFTSSLANDVAAIESDVQRLRQSANASIVGLRSSIEQLAASVLNVATEVNTRVSATRELILTVAGNLNRAINSLNDTLRSFVMASYETQVSSLRRQLSQLQNLLQQAHTDIGTLRAAQESLRQSSSTQADLESLSTRLMHQVRNIPAECGTGWTARGTSCYYYVSASMVWEEASRACFALGATLVEIEDMNEDFFIKDFFTGKGAYSVWIGLHDRSTEGHWCWISGQSIVYRNWRQNEPNNRNDEDCGNALVYGTEYGWNDSNCTTATFASVCERRVR